MNDYLKNQLDNIFYTSNEITTDQFHALSNEEKEKCIREEVNEETRYYLKQAREFTDEEATVALLIRQYKQNTVIESKLNVIEKIMIVWGCLTAIYLFNVIVRLLSDLLN